MSLEAFPCSRLLCEADRADPQADADSAYSVACCLSLAGDVEAAFAAPKLSNERGFKSPAHMEKDTDLVALHADARWAEAVARAKANQQEAMKGVNAELLGIFEADQGDRMGPDITKLDWKSVSARDVARRARVQEILDAGGAKVALDYFHAALVLARAPGGLERRPSCRARSVHLHGVEGRRFRPRKTDAFRQWPAGRISDFPRAC